MNVKNMESSKGNKVTNQFIISGLSGTKLMDNTELKSGTMFQSYDSNIAYIQYDGKIFLDSYYWNYSRTTSKYRSIFLSETTKETQKKIDDKVYMLVNLN